MVRVLGVVSLLFLSHIALVSAEDVSRTLGAKRNNIVGKLLARGCPPRESEAYSIRLIIFPNHLMHSDVRRFVLRGGLPLL